MKTLKNVIFPNLEKSKDRLDAAIADFLQALEQIHKDREQQKKEIRKANLRKLINRLKNPKLKTERL